MLVVEIDAIGTETLQRALDRRPDVRRAAVKHARALSGVRDQAELRRHDHIVATPLQRAPDEFLIGEGP
jgi:hypothetical protein